MDGRCRTGADNSATAAGGDVRAGAALALGGTLLLGADADPGSGPGRVVVPAALAVALLVFGALPPGARAAAPWRRRRARARHRPLRERARAGLRHRPRRARSLARNPAARGADPLAAAGADRRGGALPADPRGAAERRRRRDRGGRPQPRRRDPPRPRAACSGASSRAGRRRAAAAAARAAGVPWLRLDADGPRARGERRGRGARRRPPDLDACSPTCRCGRTACTSLAAHRPGGARGDAARRRRPPRPALDAARRRRGLRPRARPLPRGAAGGARPPRDRRPADLRQHGRPPAPRRPRRRRASTSPT